MNKNPKQFKIKVKFSSLSEKEKKELLFNIFDILLSSKSTEKPKEIKKKKSKKSAGELSYIILDSLPWSTTMKIEK